MNYTIFSIIRPVSARVPALFRSRRAWSKTRFLRFSPLVVLLASACAVQEVERSDLEKRQSMEKMYEEYRPEFEKAPEISVEELLERRTNETIVIVDVREDSERVVSMIPGAISKTEFENRKAEFKDTPIIVHCTIGYRSGKYVEDLTEDGLDAYNLKGSILAWAHAGQPVIDATGEETRRIHVYGKQWNLLPEDYEAVW